MRPLGDIAQALIQHAGTPAPVRLLCERAQVGYDVGRYTTSRLLQRGLLVLAPDAPAVRQGRGRPAQLVMAAPAGADEEASAMALLQRSFWDAPPALEWESL